MSTLSGSPTKPRSTTSSSGAAPWRADDLARDDHVAVLAAEADRPAALSVDRTDDLLVDRSGQHHLDDLDRRLVRHPKPAGKMQFDAELLQHRADLRPAAVHDHRIDAGLLQEHHVLGEVARLVLVAHRMPAVLHDDDRVVVAQHVRQRLHQDFGLLLRGGIEGFGASRGSGARTWAREAEARCSIEPERASSNELETIASGCLFGTNTTVLLTWARAAHISRE